MIKLVALILCVLFVFTLINGSINSGENVETLTKITQEQEKQNNSFNLEKIKESIRNRKKIFKIDQISSNHTLIREALIERGYVESKASRGFNIKWSWCWEMLGVTNKNQIVNHFINHDEIGSKSGLTKNMNKLYQNGNEQLKDEISQIFPRSYILSNPLEKKAFIKDFNRIKDGIINNNNKNNEKLVGVSNDEILLNSDNNFIDSIITTKTNDIKKQQKNLEKKEEGDELLIYPIQKHIDGNKNIWICKPNANARGVGIRIFDDLNLLLEYASQGNDEFIVQKYIESPYTIENTKFDIRQFVLVKSLNPLVIFKLKECYLRFCSIEYSNDDLNDRFVHLSNYQVQKDFSKEKNKWSKVSNQWSLSQFKDYLSSDETSKKNNNTQWDNVLNEKIKKLIITTIKSWPRNGQNKGSFELLGFDILLNDQLEPMLLEVNTNPGLHLLTDNVKVHHKIAVDDLFKVVLDNQELWYNENNKDDNNQNWIKNLTQDQQIQYFGQWEPIYVDDFDKSIDHLSIAKPKATKKVEKPN
ncbi:hypothetical protein RB653_005987 [Dictyostelium firmibasis]|uniref:Tubulin-tyrosine ligase family protein n=1 Tax=Dictyostelium firmibasis TaxID=79012 RepID=A0AAN7YZT6_9MYCE